MSDRQWSHDGYEQHTYDDYYEDGQHNTRGGGYGRDWRQNNPDQYRTEGDWKRRKTDGDGVSEVNGKMLRMSLTFGTVSLSLKPAELRRRI